MNPSTAVWTLLRRTASKTDGRCRILELTEQGMQFYDRFTAVVRQVNQRLEQNFTEEEKQQLLSFLLRVARNLEEEIDPC